MSSTSHEDPTWHLLLFVLIIGGIGWAIWHFFRVELLETLRYIRLAEFWVVSLFDGKVQPCVEWLKVAPAGQNIPTAEVFKAASECFGTANLRQMPTAEALNYYNITPTSMGRLSSLVVKYLRWPAALLCAGIGYYALYVSPRNKFKTRYDLESFIKTQAKVWPVISPIVNFSPTKHSARAPGTTVPDRLPLFAEALSPEEWISFHRIPVRNGIPDREMVRRAFLQQLGPRWNGVNDLPPHVSALFAALALKGAQKREESDDLLGRLALSWSPEKGFKMDPKLAEEVKKIVRDPALGGRALAIANQHAYRTTAMLGLLKWARFMGGVLAPAQFLWLRGEDRSLWYPLNNLGRRAFHTEGSGAMAHFMAEKAAKKPLPIPRIDTAIVTINQYLAANPVKIPPREEPGTIDGRASRV